MYSRPPIPDNIEEPQLIKDLKVLHAVGEIHIPESDTIPPEIFDAYPETKYLGSGASSIVIEDPQDPTKVIAFRYNKPELNPELDLLEKYHMHNVLHLLHPEYFPKIYSASERTGQVRKERVIPDQALNRQLGRTSRNQYVTIYRDIEYKVRLSSGIHITLDDNNPDNLMYDTEGNLKYIDFIDDHAYQFAFNRNKALSFFDERRANDPDREKVEYDRKNLIRSFNRIIELGIIDDYKTSGRIRNDLWNQLSDNQRKRVGYVLNKYEERYNQQKYPGKKADGVTTILS